MKAKAVDCRITNLRIPMSFRPPIVKKDNQGLAAFHNYDWYFEWMKQNLYSKRKVFLTPCAATKPIYSSTLHRQIYQRFASVFGKGREILVVLEPVVLIRYQDLYDFEKTFCYDFPPKFLGKEARELFVERLADLLKGKDVLGCLPRHHASLVNDSVDKNWDNFWNGDMYSMMKKASSLNR